MPTKTKVVRKVVRSGKNRSFYLFIVGRGEGEFHPHDEISRTFHKRATIVHDFTNSQC